MSETSRRKALLEEIPDLMPLALAWASAQETLVQSNGIVLSLAEISDAVKAGVQHPEKIRILACESIPLPEDPRLQSAIKLLALIGPKTAGLAFGYAMYIRADCRNDRRLLLHEFTHVAQCERVGNTAVFLAQYLTQCIEHGYLFAPFEIQAREQEELILARELPMEESGTVQWRHFIQYMEDAVNFTVDASKLVPESRADQARQLRCTRSAIIQCALALESVANCLLEFCGREKSPLPEGDGSKTLAKIDLFLSTSPQKRVLDRNHPLVAPIVSLIRCRNAYVHSKGVTEEFEHHSLTISYWDPLGLPRNSRYWRPVHAIKTLTVLSDFLNYLFFEVRGWKHFGANGRAIPLEILSSSVAAAPGKQLPAGVTRATIREEHLEFTLTADREWGLEFLFLGYMSVQAGQVAPPKRVLGDYAHCRLDDFTIPFQWIWYTVPTGFGVIKTHAPARPRIFEAEVGVERRDIRSAD